MTSSLVSTEPDAVLARIDTVARLLDSAVRVPGTEFRIGLDPILGIVPGLGDSLAAVVSLYIVLEGAVAGVPWRTLATMLATIAVDTVVGSIPVVGTVFDAAWKANQWNVRRIERHVASDAR